MEHKHTPELLAELQHAHQIILNAVAVMTSEQLSAWAQANERDGCAGDGATRYHERAEVIARAIEQAVLQSYESQLLRLLVDIRFAAGDDGKRMQGELVEHIAALRKDAERYRWLRHPDTGPAKLDSLHNWVNDDCNPPYRELKCGDDLDAAIEVAMEKQK